MGKKKKKKRLNIKRTLIFFSILFLIGYSIYKMFKIDVENIIVTGNVYVTDSQIIKLANLNNSTHYLSFNSKEVCNKIKTYPLIKSCDVKRKLGFKIEIEIVENKPILYYLNESKLILSDNSKIDMNNTFGVPTLTNYVKEDILDKFVTRLASIDSDIIRSISEIEYAPSQSSDGTFIDEELFMLSMNDGNIVYVNIRNIEVLTNYAKIYATMGERKGYYYFDSGFKNYIFKEFETNEESEVNNELR